MNWIPIISKNKSAPILEIIEEIAQSILTNTHLYSSDISLMQGSSGIILFLLNYYRFNKTDIYFDFAQELLNKNLKIVNRYTRFSYCDGIAGFIWLLHYLRKRKLIDIKESYLSELNKTCLVAAQQAFNIGNIDFLHGAFGYSMVLNKEYNKIKKKYFIDSFLESLIQRKIKFNDNDTWTDFFAKKMGYGNIINLGLAHGLPGAIILLSKMDKKSIVINNFITNSLDIILKSEFKNKKNALYPNRLNADNGKSLDGLSSRLAWCYGDLGIAYAILTISEMKSDLFLYSKAIEILRYSSKRKNLQENGLYDATFCHGTSGVAHIFNRIYQKTGNSIFKQSAIHWVEETINFRKHKEGLAYYKKWSLKDREWMNSIGLLEGIAGIGLVLLASISTDFPDWDECFLLS